jgi:hypothetical protein
MDPVLEAAGVRKYLHNGGTVLVVGARSSNFSEDFRNHPRITVWDSTDAATFQRDLPDNTRVIVSTRFIGHQLFGRLHKLARRRRLLMVPGLKNTGEIKTMLEHALGMADTSAPESTEPAPPRTHDTPPMSPVPVATPRGAVRAFLLAQDMDPSAPIAAEARRLLPLAHAAGLTLASHDSLCQALYTFRKKQSEPQSHLAPSTPQPRAAAPPLMYSAVGEALRLIDEVAAGLTLVREAVLKVQDDDRRTQEIVKALRGYLDRAPA